MSFIKKHYEKIILVFFLLVFILTMIQLILMIRQSQKVGEDDLKFEIKAPDYAKIDFTKYEVTSVLEKDVLWKQNAPRKAENKLYTDLMNPYPSGRCPACGTFIPVADFKNRKCSVCGADLVPIGSEHEEALLEKDTDADGIPDAKEIELGMNPNDPNDIYYDFDNDGFSNIFEIKYGTDIRDPKSHPPAVYRLFVNKIERKELRFNLKKIIKKGEDKNLWDIQTYEYFPTKGRMDDRYRKIGDQMIIDGTKYKIVDIIPKQVERMDPSIKKIVSEDVSEIIIQAEGENPITVKPKAKVFENKETIELVDHFTKETFRLILNETFSVSTPSAESEQKYILFRIVNREGKIVEIISADDPKLKFEVGPEPIEALKEKAKEPTSKQPELFDPKNLEF